MDWHSVAHYGRRMITLRSLFSATILMNSENCLPSLLAQMIVLRCLSIHANCLLASRQSCGEQRSRLPVHITCCAQAMGTDAHIVTVRGVGYRMSMPATETAAEPAPR